MTSIAWKNALVRALVGRPVRPGDRVTHKPSLAAGDCAEDEIVGLDAEQAHLTGGSVDLDDLADDWVHFDGTPIDPWS